MNSALWYTARGTGVMTLVLFTVVMVLGIMTRSGREVAGTPRFALNLLHRNVSLLGVVFLAVHVVTLLLDSFAKLSPLDIVVPFLGAYKPLWQGLGTLSLDLMLAIVITSLLRNRIGVRVWRAVHWMAYASWPIALLHGLGNGTDVGTWWLRALTAGCFAAVGVALLWRVQPGFFLHSKTRRVSVPLSPEPPAALGQWGPPAPRPTPRPAKPARPDTTGRPNARSTR